MKYTRMEINLGVIADNYEKIVRTLPQGTQVLAVVKADAYGLGAVPVAKKLEKAGCPAFAVTFFEEAEKLREAGIAAPVLVMMPIEEEEIEEAEKRKVTVTVTDYETAKKLSDHSGRYGGKIPAHLKVDCGLSRMGIVLKDRMAEAAEEAERICKLPGIKVEAVYTHLTAAGMQGEYASLDREEIRRFSVFTKALEKKNIHLKRHFLSSDPYAWYPQDPGDYIRIGSGLYGVRPQRYDTWQIQNCLTMKTRVVQTKWLPEGTEVSYGPLYRTGRKTRIAIVPVGFADGLRRALSNKGDMLIHGQRVPIIGKICCDHTILDVTDIGGVKPGDEVTIFGEDGSLFQTAGDYAMLCNASDPETTVLFSNRIPRVYLDRENEDKT